MAVRGETLAHQEAFGGQMGTGREQGAQAAQKGLGAPWGPGARWAGVRARSDRQRCELCAGKSEVLFVSGVPQPGSPVGGTLWAFLGGKWLHRQRLRRGQGPLRPFQRPPGQTLRALPVVKMGVQKTAPRPWQELTCHNLRNNIGVSYRETCPHPPALPLWETCSMSPRHVCARAHMQGTCQPHSVSNQGGS